MASQHEVENRVNEAEDLLCAGLSGGLIERKLSERYKVTTRQARSYVARVYERWKEQRALDQPHRREKVLRMIERFYAKAMLDKQYSAAATALGLLTKMVGVDHEAHLPEVRPVFTLHYDLHESEDPDRE